MKASICLCDRNGTDTSPARNANHAGLGPGPLWAGRDKENQFPSLSDGGGPRAPIAVWEENKPRGLEVTVPLVLLSGCSYMMGEVEGSGVGGLTGRRRSRKRKRKE